MPPFLHIPNDIFLDELSNDPRLLLGKLMYGPFVEGRVPKDIKGNGEYQDDARNKDDLKNQGSRSKRETHSKISVLFFKEVNYVDTLDGNHTDPDHSLDQNRHPERKT
jgi:hypothetical protein